MQPMISRRDAVKFKFFTFLSLLVGMSILIASLLTGGILSLIDETTALKCSCNLTSEVAIAVCLIILSLFFANCYKRDVGIPVYKSLKRVYYY